jgi:hypothetical protein
MVEACRLIVLAEAPVFDTLALLVGRALAAEFCTLPDCLDRDWREVFPLDTEDAVGAVSEDGRLAGFVGDLALGLSVWGFFATAEVEGLAAPTPLGLELAGRSRLGSTFVDTFVAVLVTGLEGGFWRVVGALVALGDFAGSLVALDFTSKLSGLGVAFGRVANAFESFALKLLSTSSVSGLLLTAVELGIVCGG